MVGFFELAVSGQMLLVILRIGDLLEVAADDRRRFVVLGDGHGFEAALAFGHVNVAAHEVHEVRALEQQLRHPGVVVVGAETWQSVQPLVSLARTVCGTKVLKACPLKPSDEIVCCW